MNPNLASILIVVPLIAAILWVIQRFERNFLPHARLGGYVTLLDLKKIEAGEGYNIVEENVKLHPEFRIIPADTISNTEMELTVRTELPIVGFSQPNYGIGSSKSTYITRLFQAAYLDAFIGIDVRLLQNRTAEAAGRYMESEQSGYIESAMRYSCRQFWYGLQNDRKGFVGLIAQMINDAEHVIDAGGGADETGDQTSIFFVGVGPEKVQWLFGNNRTLAFDDWKQQTSERENPDGTRGKIEEMFSWLHFAPGARLGNRNALVRIKNITAGHPANYDLMQQALKQMTQDLGIIPQAIFMAGSTQLMLRNAVKTALIPNPPLPTEFENIPIYPSYSILTGETI